MRRLLRYAGRQNMGIWLLAVLIGFSAVRAGDDDPPSLLVFPSRMHIPVRKVTKLHLFLYVQTRVKVRDPQGIAATRLDSWDDPDESRDDDEIVVYGVNSGENLVIYNTSLTTIAMYGRKQRGEQRLKKPHGISASSWGDVYVADTGNDRVVHLFNPKTELKFVRELRADGMKAPRDVVLTADSSVFVADTGNDRVLFMRADTLLRVIAGPGKEPGQLIAPIAVAANARQDKWSYWHDEFVVVLDNKGKRLQKFSRDGKFLGSIDVKIAFGRDVDLQYLEIDYYSNIWASDKRNHCLHKFDRNLQYLGHFGSKGSGDREFMEPRGISMYKRFGQVLVAEKESAQYYWVGTDFRDFTARVDSAGFLQIDYFLQETSFVTLELLDASGKVIKTLVRNSRRHPGQNIEKYDGNGRELPYHRQNQQKIYSAPYAASRPKLAPGSYSVKMTASATYSSYKYFEKTGIAAVKFQ